MKPLHKLALMFPEAALSVLPPPLLRGVEMDHIRDLRVDALVHVCLCPHSEQRGEVEMNHY